MYYKFFWGDNTDSGWIGPYNSGETASASHVWTAHGTKEVTAIVKIGSGGLPSDPSNSLSVRVYKVGDCNGDDLVNPGDINPFVLMLSSGETAYYQAFPDGYFYTGDINLDDLVNFGDINPFVALLSGGG